MGSIIPLGAYSNCPESAYPLRIDMSEASSHPPGTKSRPLVTSTGLITGLIAFSLPFMSDFIILGSSGQMVDVLKNPMSLIIFGIYGGLGFWLLDSAMRPRRRVRIALWLGLIMTSAIWLAYALTGRIHQLDQTHGDMHLGIYMILMAWPMVCAVLMGCFAKIGEKHHVT